MHEPAGVGLHGFSDPQTNEIVMQGGYTVEKGRIVERARHILNIFPGVGTGQVDDPVVGIGKIAWIVRRLSQGP